MYIVTGSQVNSELIKVHPFVYEPESLFVGTIECHLLSLTTNSAFGHPHTHTHTLSLSLSLNLRLSTSRLRLDFSTSRLLVSTSDVRRFDVSTSRL